MTDSYGWPEAQVDLARGVRPSIVGERLGENAAYILEVADAQGWPVTWNATRPVADVADRLDA
jgi:hypothetical protein